MILSEKIHAKVFNSFLVLIASFMMFRSLCTITLLLFVVYNLFNLDKIKKEKSFWVLVFYISLPLLVNLIFIWNNSSLHDGFKASEKYLALFILPVFIIGNYQYISFHSLLKKYCLFFCILLTLMFLRYIIYFPELFFKYVNGIDIWEMGYSFTNSFGNHAPAINMHISFAIMSVFYLFLKAINQEFNNKKIISLYIGLFVFLFFFLLYVNTRLALINTMIGLVIIMISYGLKIIDKSKFLLIIIFTFVFIGSSLSFLVYKNPYMIQKYTTVTFANMDKIGRLDEIDNVQAVAYNSLVTRVSIWQTTLNLGIKKPFIGYGGADSKIALFEYYKETSQFFLYRNKLPVHNQLIDFFLKFGILGILVYLAYMITILYLGCKLRDPLIISFFVLFFISTMSDDFLIRFDGIVYSGFWISIFASTYVKKDFNN